MDPATDFLILYDLAPAGLHGQLLDIYFENPSCRQSFERIAHDRTLRALFEFEYNGAVPFEDCRLLEAQGYLRDEGQFRSHVRSEYGRAFSSVASTDKGKNITVSLPDSIDPHVFFPPFVEAYLCRLAGKGIVAKRETLEIAMDIEDDDFLALLVDPCFGTPIFPELADSYQLETRDYLCDLYAGMSVSRWFDHDEIEAKRREKADWWSTPERGLIIHDLTIPHPAIDQVLRGLPCDEEVLRCFKLGDKRDDPRSSYIDR